MFCCAHDPGLALFIAEDPTAATSPPGVLEWAALSGTVVFAALAVIFAA